MQDFKASLAQQLSLGDSNRVLQFKSSVRTHAYDAFANITTLMCGRRGSGPC